MNVDDTVWLSREHARESRAKLSLEQMGLALRNLALDHWIMPVFTAILCARFWRWVAPARLIGWFAAEIVCLVPFTLIAKSFRRRKPDPERWHVWAVALTASYLLTTLAWSSIAVLLWVPHDNLNHMIILVVLACTIAGSSALVSACKPLTVVSFLSYGSALVLAPLQEGGFVHDGGALLALFFVFYLAHMARQMHATAREMLMLKSDKNDLILALAFAKSESDEARRMAEAASRAKSQFLANMSHELRTPLNAILGFSEMIGNNVAHGDASKDHEYAGLIHGSGHHLLTLINDILDLAKIEAGGFTLRETEVDLDRMIDDALVLMAPNATSGGCALTKDVAPGLPKLLADERAIKQILLNLASNAVKFTRPGGTVSVFARSEPDGCIALGVRDTGVGIAQEDQTRVFESFGQGRHDIKTADKGTGLGLPIVKGLAEAHGGGVVLQSAVGVGTIVTVRFPAKRMLAAKLRAAS